MRSPRPATLAGTDLHSWYIVGYDLMAETELERGQPLYEIRNFNH